MKKPKIALLGLTLDLYQKKATSMIPRLEEFSYQLKDVLSDIGDMVHYPIAWDTQSMTEAFDTFKRENVDGVILVFLSYSQSLTLLPIAKESKIPILIWNTQKLKEITDAFTPEDSSSNHGMHGVQDLTSVFLREKVPFSLITGHYKDIKVLKLVSDWCKATYATSKLKKTNIGRIGNQFPNMGDFDVDPQVLKAALGVNTKEIDNNELINFKDLPLPSETDIQKILDFDIDWSPYIDENTKLNSLKTFFYLKELSLKENIDGWAINFQGLTEDIPMPFLGISLLLREGFGYGGEGDIYSSTAVLLAQIFSKNKATFTEMFTTDYENSRIYMTHMGESNIGLRRETDPVKMGINKMALGNKVPTIVPSFSVKPGVYTLFNFPITHTNELKIIMTLVDVLDVKPFEKMRTPHFLISPRGKKVEEFLTSYSMEGGTHHLALASGDIREKIKFFSSINNIIRVEI